eukprot:11291314-Heterocapsa_arctica.AAC.1
MELHARPPAGHYSVVLAALPCKPWSCWQRYNVRVVDDNTFQQLQKARVESINLWHFLWFVVKSWRRT